MTSGSITACAAAALSCILAIAVILRRRSVPAWFFAAGMMLFAVESWLGGLSLSQTDPRVVAQWHRNGLIVKSLFPFVWMAFSLTYLRGDYQQHLRQWRAALVAALVVPVGLVAGFGELFDAVTPIAGSGWWIRYALPATALTVAVLLSFIIILMNLERTLRAAVGSARWKIKFAMLGLGLIFGTRIYTNSQILLYSGFNVQLVIPDTSALLVGCILISIALVRQGFGHIDIYPSRAVLQGSVTLILAGGYLFLIGVLAQVASALGGAGSFQFQAVVVLAGVALLAVLLFSDRLRQRMRAFMARHFRRPQHDSRTLWSSFTHRLSSVTSQRAYCGESVKLIAESFQILSVTLWLHEERKDALCLVASSLPPGDGQGISPPQLAPAAPLLDGLLKAGDSFDLERNPPSWAASLLEVSPSQFGKGGGRYCLPLLAGGRAIGAITLVDRVDAIPYSDEELDLLRCIADQVAAGLLQFQLMQELMQGKEVEAFQSMAAFFVHDLKNAASSLGLMLQNLPVHFDDPAFRADALRGIGSTVNRINQITSRLGSLRHNLEVKPIPENLVTLVEQAVDDFEPADGIEVIRELQAVPPVLADRGQIDTVLTNLLLNAREAMDRGGRLKVSTSRQGDRAVISVSDTGCGMAPEFMRDSLFRPFRTTKKKGLGIGMFQCRMIIAAHNGSIRVESHPDEGTAFHISLPLAHKSP